MAWISRTGLVLLALALALFVAGQGTSEAKKKRSTTQVQAAQATPRPEAKEPPQGRGVAERESKIEFDERLVQGQTAQGAIYLFQRGESDFKSLLRIPGSFRGRTVRPVFEDPAR
ncbi:MAG: hypothetical protein HY698_06830 [Deltaproteobacteria bacterium]|nr:hypothetical protein [Deltaproteobacteria bacterium]